MKCDPRSAVALYVEMTLYHGNIPFDLQFGSWAGALISLYEFEWVIARDETYIRRFRCSMLLRATIGTIRLPAWLVRQYSLAGCLQSAQTRTDDEAM